MTTDSKDRFSRATSKLNVKQLQQRVQLVTPVYLGPADFLSQSSLPAM